MLKLMKISNGKLWSLTSVGLGFWSQVSLSEAQNIEISLDQRPQEIVEVQFHGKQMMFYNLQTSDNLEDWNAALNAPPRSGWIHLYEPADEHL